MLPPVKSPDPPSPRKILEAICAGVVWVWDRDYEGTGGVYGCVIMFEVRAGYHSYNLQLPGGQTSQCVVEMQSDRCLPCTAPSGNLQ